MKILRQGLALAVLGAGLTGLSPTTTAAATPAAAVPQDRTLVQRLQSQASGEVALSDQRATGRVGFARATGAGADLLPGVSAGTPAATVAKAQAYVDEFAPAFGAPASQLVRDEVTRDSTGTVVTWTQEYDGVPVFGSMLRAHLDDQGDLTAVNGELVPVSGLATEPRFSAAEAGRTAVSMVRAQPPTDDEGNAGSVQGIEATDPSLVVYRSGLAQGVAGGENELAWSVEVTNGANVRDMVFVDAATDKVLNRYSLVHGALDRELYEADQDRNLTLVWEEGDPLPGDLNADQENLVRSTGESYWLFRNAFGRDSYDGAGATMRTINNDPAISCPNANWNGTTTNYCDGVTSDDVVSHEWGHAYTEYTHGLIYQWQPGALNEGYSDVFGETLDLINGREDEGEGDISSPRPVGACSTSSPAKPLLTINSPSEIAKDCLTGGASFGEQLTAEGITGDVVAPTDAVEEGGTATDGCSPYEQDVTGQVVLVDRGLCAFTEKAEMATEEGAAALIIGNRDDAPIGMSGDDPSLVATVSIGLTDRELIRTALADGETVNVTMKDAGGERTSSFRWLVGEKSEAFGGAIRDMWNPTCYGDPGKVSDAEYKCSTDDNGGVHSNSGVVNRGYSLLVDGGDYNGVSVGGIGLDKALNVYYKAMTDYQTPASDFADHADSLEASCADLTGKAINELSTEPNDVTRSVDKITADDCAQVAAMAQAVELRLDPTDKCNFQPLLAPGDPGTCGEGFTETEVFGEDFEDGLDAWTLESENPYGGQTFPWTTTRQYRGDHESTVAFSPGPDEGDCSGTPSDITSVDWMTSGDIELPASGDAAQRMSFEHYVATELGYDGGNVQVALNGGEFAPVPAEAYVFNEPDQISTEGEGNTNPLAGEPGFTGTDGGTVFGSWGTSVIDLGAAGAEPGDTMQVRFAMGRDGCGGAGFFGWNVDNISVSVCEEAPGGGGSTATTTTVRRTIPQPVRTGRPFAVKVAVDAEGDTVPQGQVVLKLGKRTLGTDTVNTRGIALVESERTFAKPGRRTVRAVFRGGDELDRSRDRFRLTVVRR